jgi:formylglycine-generating enzyme required for sulfatase activity
MRRSLKFGLIVGAGLATLACVAMRAPRSHAAINVPLTIALQPQSFEYRPAGEFTRNGERVNPPLRTVYFDRPVMVMTYQVTAADYRRCVLAHACPPSPEVHEGPDWPAVKVSWHDAQAYAAWLSGQLGARYRLPTDEEWAFAAGSRFRGETFDAGGKDAMQRLVARYELEAGGDESVGGEPRPIGSFGANENGLFDLAGNVWEWTSTCYTHQILERADAPILNCGIRVVEGRHRSYMPDFIRDPRGGGCSVGIPPTYLGFRLVRESSLWRSLQYSIRRLLPYRVIG